MRSCGVSVWGKWLRGRVEPHRLLGASLTLSVYSSLPALSFMTIPIVTDFSGWNVLSSADGLRFGIPEFLHLPWPFDTILGFYSVMILAVVVFKVIISVGEIFVMYHVRPGTSRGV